MIHHLKPASFKQLRLVVLVLLLTTFFTSILIQPAQASLAGFTAGNIMEDGVMANKNTMSEAQIQSFLKSKNSCNDSNLSRLSGYNANEGWLHSNGKTFYYNLKNGKFVCMADENFNGESAARIIWQAAQDYNINPQVIIVLLQKEQGLVTDTWPNKNHQYAAATGYDCPDSGNGCNNANAGFKTQIRKAAQLFRTVLDGGWSNYPVGVNYVQYHPNKACGGTNVNIVNRATSALYRYTPYQPNQAALNAGYGTGDGCSAYGNRNFYNYFTDWFGSAHINPWSDMLQKRIMTIDTTALGGNPTYKVNQITGEVLYDDPLVDGTEIYFYSKSILPNGSPCLRTKIDTHNGLPRCILLSRLKEFEPVYQNVIAKEQYMVAQRSTYKLDYAADEVLYDNEIKPQQMIKFSKKVTAAGQTLYITDKDVLENAYWRGILAQRLKPLQDSFENFMQPRTMRINNSSKVINVSTGLPVKVMPADMHVYFNRKLDINGETYYTGSYFTDDNQYFAINSSDVSDEIVFQQFLQPRTMKLKANTRKMLVISTESVDDLLMSGASIHFSQKLLFENKDYYRTTHDLNQNLIKVIDASLVSDL